VRKLKVGIVGCGAIGSSLAEAVACNFSKQAKLTALYDINIPKAKKLSKMIFRNKDFSVVDLKHLIDRSDLVIECASSKSSWNIAKSALGEARDIMIMSVGGVAGHFNELRKLAEKRHCKVYIPSGAIAGIDALKALGIGKIKKVILTTRKNPISFKQVKYIQALGVRLDKIKKDRVLFYGKAKEAVRYFPQNINVSSVLSMAGIGQDKTQVKIIASPKLKTNIHEIQIQSDAARLFIHTENIAHPDNPKTSYLAVLSAVATIKQILEPIKIGT